MKIVYGESQQTGSAGRDGGDAQTEPRARSSAETERVPDRDAPGGSWDAEHTGLSASQHEFEDHVTQIALEAKNAVSAASEACVATRRALERAQIALRALGEDTEGLWFVAYVALSALVVVAEVATGVANAFLVTVPPVVRDLLMVAFVLFPPLTAIALGEVLRPLRFRRPFGIQYGIPAVLLVVFGLTYLVITYRLRAVSVTLSAEDALLPSDLEAAALTAIAAGGYLLSIVAALTRESWRRYRLAAEVRRLRSSLRVHETRLARARRDLARTSAASQQDAEPPSAPARGSSEPRPPASSAGSAAVALIIALVTLPHGAQAAVAPRCAEGVEWLRAAIPADSRLALIVTTQQISDEQRSLDRAMAKAVLGCAGARTVVTVRAITATALTDAPAWHGTVPADPAGTDPYAPVRGRGFLAEAGGAIDRAIAPLPSSAPLGSDILGALAASGQEWSVVPGSGIRVAVIVASGWQQSRDLNLFSYQGRAATKITEALRKLRHDGTLPDLRGARVYLVGLTPGARAMATTNAQIQSLCAFWSAIVTASNGELKLCVGTLPGVART